MKNDEDNKAKIDNIPRGIRGIAGELCIEMEKQGITAIEFNFGGGARDKNECVDNAHTHNLTRCEVVSMSENEDDNNGGHRPIKDIAEELFIALATQRLKVAELNLSCGTMNVSIAHTMLRGARMPQEYKLMIPKRGREES